MNTIEYGDKENKNTPVKHLKSSDYFDVEKFPISTFSITKVAYADRGNMGITNPVTFPAQIEVKDGVIKATGKLTVTQAAQITVTAGALSGAVQIQVNASAAAAIAIGLGTPAHQ